MSGIVQIKTDLKAKEILGVVGSLIAEKLTELLTTLASLGIVPSSYIYLPCSLLVQLALKYGDAIRLQMLESEIEGIRTKIDGGVTITWDEKNVRTLFMLMEKYARESHDAKRGLLAGAIERFIRNGHQFSDDLQAYFIRLVGDLTQSDVEYLSWAVEEGRFIRDVSTEETAMSRYGGVVKLAKDDSKRLRNLHVLVGAGLVVEEPVLGGQSYTLGPTGIEFYEWLTGKKALQGSAPLPVSLS